MSVRYLLDTNAASYAINKKSAAMDRHLARRPMAELGISAVTEGELRFGAARSGSAPLQATVEQFLLVVTVFSWDSEAAREYGHLRAALEREGRLMGSLDMMIAAHALALGLTLITNDRAFGRIKGLKMDDWTK
ncbi:MAG TPA: type II toxin-antitoxin system VapC family toxin [Candidatus Acidoferrales bacterium]|nr:type II toxin-antitoxin system VapC family toxin [Candidatus Acidoferrales bacterium]